MAFSKSLLFTLVLSLLVLHNVADALNCGAACEARCSLSSRPNLCKRACGTCCMRCNCVPPGTSGNQELCPCYYAQTTRGGKRKCP
ncbi:hypothetical protein V2J09_023910 [Rumex salicifolius]